MKHHFTLTAPLAPLAALNSGHAVSGALSTPPRAPSPAPAAPTSACVPAQEDADEAAWMTLLNDCYDDQQRLNPLEGQPDLATLRAVFLDVHGGAALPTLAHDTPDLAWQVVRRGCAAPDDDNFTVFVIDGGALTATIRHHESEGTAPFERDLRALNLRPGQVLIVWHQHICATDCFALAADLLRGYKLT